MIFKDEWEALRTRATIIRAELGGFDMSPNLVFMLIAAEDHRYGKHPGVDIISVFRAVWRTLFCGRREGASTIAMQLVRVVTGRYDRTIKRKFVEMCLAVQLTRNFHKNDIPKMYLAIAYYGWKMNGLMQASRRLHLNQSNLSKFEAAFVIARLKYPEPKQPSMERCRQIEERAGHILRREGKFCASLDMSQYKVSNADGTI